jgi:hypothetical protein
MTTKHNRPAGRSDRAAAAKGINLHSHSTTNQPAGSIPVRRGDGRIVGTLAGDVLSKVARPEHMLQRPAAWAWDDSILDAAERAGARFTEIECDGRIYRASLSDFRRYGFPIRRGYGDQRGLALTYWHVRRAGEPPAAVQMTLWGDR